MSVPVTAGTKASGAGAAMQDRSGERNAASLPASGAPGHRHYIIDDPTGFADDLVNAYVETWPGLLRRTAEGLVVRKRRKASGRVGLVIGNGVGHEPAMLGFVGHGLFDVNVPGGIFAAPPPLAIAHGIRRADFGAGVLLCVSNHSGDLLNAEMAIEIAKGEGLDCRMVVLGDDASSSDRTGRRRGGAGLLFTWKVVGAAAEAGYDLAECARVALRACQRSGSLSATLQGTVNPTTGQEISRVPGGRILLGAGVHGDGAGEPLDQCSARELATIMVDRLAPALSLQAGDRALTMVNDAGAMSVAESSLVHYRVLEELGKRSVDVVGSWVGRYATTLATAGLAVALLKVDDEILDLWKATCRAPALVSWGAGPVG